MADMPVDPDADVPLHRQPSSLALVAFGALFGTYARYVIEELLPHSPGQWPWATFLINLGGAFVLGFLLEGLTRLGPDDGWRRRARLGIGTGACGAFTTYSTFALEGAELFRDGHIPTAVGYFVASVVAGVVCAWLGIVAASQIRTTPREVVE